MRQIRIEIACGERRPADDDATGAPSGRSAAAILGGGDMHLGEVGHATARDALAGPELAARHIVAFRERVEICDADAGQRLPGARHEHGRDGLSAEHDPLQPTERVDAVFERETCVEQRRG
jgi:hypothetical protein